MKLHLYFIYNSILLIITSIVFLVFTLHYRQNLLVVVFFIIAEAYFVQNIWKGICLIVDIIVGSKKRNTVFLGVLNTETLDFFRTKYTNVYFDDDEMPKNYIAFMNSIEEDIMQGDKVAIEYYKYSRIVLNMKKIKE